MAGSYNHCVHHDGGRWSPLAPGKMQGEFDYGDAPGRGAGVDGQWVPLIENLGDASEALEEMYGMIWYLANRLAVEVIASEPTRDDLLPIIEDARQNYSRGVELGTGHPARW